MCAAKRSGPKVSHATLKDLDSRAWLIAEARGRLSDVVEELREVDEAYTLADREQLAKEVLRNADALAYATRSDGQFVAEELREARRLAADLLADVLKRRAAVARFAATRGEIARLLDVAYVQALRSRGPARLLGATAYFLLPPYRTFGEPAPREQALN